VLERMKEENSEEARYKRFDERIRNYQQSRREVAASEERSKAKKNNRRRKSLHNRNMRTYEKDSFQ